MRGICSQSRPSLLRGMQQGSMDHDVWTRFESVSTKSVRTFLCYKFLFLSVSYWSSISRQVHWSEPDTLKELYNDIWLLLSVLEKHRNRTAWLTVFLCGSPLCHHAILFILSNLSLVFCGTIFSVISSTSIYGKQLHAWVYVLFSMLYSFYLLCYCSNQKESGTSSS